MFFLTIPGFPSYWLSGATSRGPISVRHSQGPSFRLRYTRQQMPSGSFPRYLQLRYIPFSKRAAVSPRFRRSILRISGAPFLSACVRSPGIIRFAGFVSRVMITQRPAECNMRGRTVFFMGPAGHGTGSGMIEWHMAAWLYAQLGEPTVQVIKLPVHVFVFRIIQRICGTGFSVPAESRFLLCDGRKEEKTGDAFFRTAYNARCTSPGAVTAVIDTLKIQNYNRHNVWR